MSIIPPKEWPRRSVDASGRALPMTEEEVRSRNEIAISALDAIAEMGDEEEHSRSLEAIIRGIDENPLSYRKRFG